MMSADMNTEKNTENNTEKNTKKNPENNENDMNLKNIQASKLGCSVRKTGQGRPDKEIRFFNVQGKDVHVETPSISLLAIEHQSAVIDVDSIVKEFALELHPAQAAMKLGAGIPVDPIAGKVHWRTMHSKQEETKRSNISIFYVWTASCCLQTLDHALELTENAKDIRALGDKYIASGRLVRFYRIINTADSKWIAEAREMASGGEISVLDDAIKVAHDKKKDVSESERGEDIKISFGGKGVIIPGAVLGEKSLIEILKNLNSSESWEQVPPEFVYDDKDLHDYSNLFFTQQPPGFPNYGYYRLWNICERLQSYVANALLLDPSNRGSLRQSIKGLKADLLTHSVLDANSSLGKLAEDAKAVGALINRVSNNLSVVTEHGIELQRCDNDTYLSVDKAQRLVQFSRQPINALKVLVTRKQEDMVDLPGEAFHLQARAVYHNGYSTACFLAAEQGLLSMLLLPNADGSSIWYVRKEKEGIVFYQNKDGQSYYLAQNERGEIVTLSEEKQAIPFRVFAVELWQHLRTLWRYLDTYIPNAERTMTGILRKDLSKYVKISDEAKLYSGQVKITLKLSTIIADEEESIKQVKAMLVTKQAEYFYLRFGIIEEGGQVSSKTVELSNDEYAYWSIYAALQEEYEATEQGSDRLIEGELKYRLIDIACHHGLKTESLFAGAHFEFARFVDSISQFADKAADSRLLSPSMVMGNAGAGKSTFINYMLGNDLESVEITESEEEFPDPLDEMMSELDKAGTQPQGQPAENSPAIQPQKTGGSARVRVSMPARIELYPEIGHGARSETKYPARYGAYCDLPGVHDTDGPRAVARNKVGLYFASRLLTGVKGIIIVLGVDDVTVRRSHDLIPLFADIKEVTPKLSAQQAVFVINFKSAGHNKRDILQSIKDFKQKLGKDIRAAKEEMAIEADNAAQIRQGIEKQEAALSVLDMMAQKIGATGRPNLLFWEGYQGDEFRSAVEAYLEAIPVMPANTYFRVDVHAIANQLFLSELEAWVSIEYYRRLEEGYDQFRNNAISLSYYQQYVSHVEKTGVTDKSIAETIREKEALLAEKYEKRDKLNRLVKFCDVTLGNSSYSTAVDKSNVIDRRMRDRKIFKVEVGTTEIGLCSQFRPRRDLDNYLEEEPKLRLIPSSEVEGRYQGFKAKYTFKHGGEIKEGFKIGELWGYEKDLKSNLGAFEKLTDGIREDAKVLANFKKQAKDGQSLGRKLQLAEMRKELTEQQRASPTIKAELKATLDALKDAYDKLLPLYVVFTQDESLAEYLTLSKIVAFIELYRRVIDDLNVQKQVLSLSDDFVQTALKATPAYRFFRAPPAGGNDSSLPIQLGWNCFDVAIQTELMRRADLGISFDRSTFLQYALARMSLPEYRALLVPEIRDAAALAAVHMNLAGDLGEDRKKAEEIANLFALAEGLKRDGLDVQAFVTEQVNQLLKQGDNDLSAFALPKSMRTSKLRNLFNAYLRAHEDMKEPICVCNEHIGRREGNRLSMEELDSFFREEANKIKYGEAYKTYQSARDRVFRRAEQDFLDYCGDEATCRQYVREYYGQKGWFAFQADTGENSTSMIDIVARYLGVNIVIYHQGSGEQLYATNIEAEQGVLLPPLEITFNGHDHFMAGKPPKSEPVMRK